VVKPDVPDLILSVPAEHSDSVETNILVNKPSFLLALFIDLLYVGWRELNCVHRVQSLLLLMWRRLIVCLSVGHNRGP